MPIPPHPGQSCELQCTLSRFQRSELDYLIYNDPLAYADLILNSKLNVLFE